MIDIPQQVVMEALVQEEAMEDMQDSLVLLV
jgi:hypothetical protein